MKWLKSNGILFSFFLVLALFSYIHFAKNQASVFKKKESEKIFFNFNKKDIVAIDFYIKSKFYFKLQKIKKKWFVVSHNVKDLASKTAVSIFLIQLFKEKKQAIDTEQNLSDYQLKPAKQNIIVYFNKSNQSNQSNKLNKLNKSNQSNKLNKLNILLGSQSFDKKRFISFLDSKKVFIANSDMNFALNASFNSLRSRQLFIKDAKFDKIILKNKKKQLILYKKNKLWTALSKTKKSIKLDKLKINQFISRLKNLEADQFIRENILNSKTVLKNYKLAKPDLFLSVFNKQRKKIWSLSASANKKNNLFYAKKSNKNTIYSLTKENYEALNSSLKKLKAQPKKPSQKTPKPKKLQNQIK